MTTPQPDFRRGLQSLEQAIKDSPLPDSLRQPPWTRRRIPGPLRLGLAVAVVTALALAMPWSPSPTAPPDSEPMTRVLFSSAACMPATVEPRLRLPKGCSIEVRHPDMVIKALADAEVEHTHQGLRIVQGDLHISVPPAPGAGAQPVLVSGGRVEAVASQFRVQQDASGSGSVQVGAGSVVFISAEAGPVTLAHGAKHRWTRSGPQLPPAQWSKARIDREVAAASQARAEGKYQQARERLTQLLMAPVGESVAEILSFELGGLLERKLHDRQSSCAHWKMHQARFGGGTYNLQVEQAIAQCESGNFRGRQE